MNAIIVRNGELVVSQTLDDLLHDLNDLSVDIFSPAGVGNRQGVLPEPNRSYVAACLNTIAERIAILRNPFIDPTLQPPDVGDVLGNYHPTYTNQYAASYVTLATEAYANVLSAQRCDKYIGDRIATMTALMPGFRKVAGIDPQCEQTDRRR